MKNNLIIKKCIECGAIVKVIEDCNCSNCGIKCCNKNMEVLIPNSTEANEEKHIPKYKIIDDEIFVELTHPMEKEHYIQWITQVKENKEETVYLYPEQNAQVTFKYIPEATIFAYCNKHGLWQINVSTN